MELSDEPKQKSHRKKQAGSKATKKKKKAGNEKDNQRNPKAFIYRSAVKAAKSKRRTLDLKTKKHRLPQVDRTPLEPPPVLVAVVGPPKVGKSTLITGLVKHFTRQTLTNQHGPVTVVSGKKRRLTFVECNNDINCMIDIAKVADLVLLLVDASFGFEMETFEFLNILQVHGFPRVMGILTHLDMMKNNKNMKKTKKKLKQRFWTEIYQGAKLFYLTGLRHGQYLKNELHNLGRFISVMKFRPLEWQSSHPYILTDRMEQLTLPEEIKTNPQCDRTICLFGYMRGACMKPGSRVHIPGCGDFSLDDMSLLPDPCPLPDKEKKRSLDERERLIYAPMAGVGGMVYDKDAVYIELGGSHSMRAAPHSNDIIVSLIGTQEPLDTKMSTSEIQLVQDSVPLTNHDKGTIRRKVEFEPQGGSDGDSEKSDSEDEDHVRTVKRKTLKGIATSSDDDSSGHSENETMELSTGTRWKARKSKIKKSKENKGPCTSSTNCKSEDNDSGNTEYEAEDEDKNETEDEDKYETEDEDKYETEDCDVNDFLDIEAEEGEDYDEMSWEDEESETESDVILEEAQETVKVKKIKSLPEDEVSNDDSDITDDDNSEVLDHLRWKENLTEKATQSFKNRFHKTAALKKLVYGGHDIETERDEESKEEDMEVGGLFHVREATIKRQRQSLYHQMDTSLSKLSLSRDWSSEDNVALVKHLFVTGDWGELDAQALLEEDDAMYGDFEDLETGECHINENEKEDERQQKKRELKKAFDDEYDQKDEDNYFNDMKSLMSEQAERNRKEFESLNPEQRLAYEGAQPGAYVRLEIKNVPCEFVRYFDPAYPIIIGGLLAGEDKLGYVRVRLKKHRWYKKILKTRDPLIVSMGWRRFQTMMVYSIEDHNMRCRMLKYTPEHLHCTSSFYGPVTPPGTGLLGIQTVNNSSVSDFRITATGVVLEMEKSTKIVKKLKLTGAPYKIFKNTAFIKGMFNSALECAKFEGASVRTVSGIRGQIKKALSSPVGAFRATFEDKLLASDIIFLPTWFSVDVPRYYNPVTTLLCRKKEEWQGMKTVGQLRHELGIKAPVNKDSLYRTQERGIRKFNPLKIPRSLEKELPFKSRPKLMEKRKRKDIVRKRAVVLEPGEKRVRTLIQQLTTLHREKEKKRKQKHRTELAKHVEKKKIEEEKRQQSTRLLRKRFYQELGLAEKRKEKHRKIE